MTFRNIEIEESLRFLRGNQNFVKKFHILWRTLLTSQAINAILQAKVSFFLVLNLFMARRLQQRIAPRPDFNDEAGSFFYPRNDTKRHEKRKEENHFPFCISPDSRLFMSFRGLSPFFAFGDAPGVEAAGCQDSENGVQADRGAGAETLRKPADFQPAY